MVVGQGRCDERGRRGRYRGVGQTKTRSSRDEECRRCPWKTLQSSVVRSRVLKGTRGQTSHLRSRDVTGVPQTGAKA